MATMTLDRTDMTTDEAKTAETEQPAAPTTDEATLVYEGVKARKGVVPEFVTNWALSALSLFIGLAIWTFVSVYALGSRSFLLPTPWQVLTKSLLAPSHLKVMLAALALTTRVALLGLAIAFVIGTVTAIAMKHSAFAEKALYPYAVILQTIPVLALVPLLGLWFGYGFASRTTVCVLFCLFPIISNTLFGLKSIDQGMQDLFASREASFWQRLWKLEMPAALPSMFTGLRTSSGLAVVGAVVADMYFTQGTPGIGTLITVYTSRLQSMDLFGAIVLSALLGLIVFQIFTKISDAVIGRWHLTRKDE